MTDELQRDAAARSQARRALRRDVPAVGEGYSVPEAPRGARGGAGGPGGAPDPDGGKRKKIIIGAVAAVLVVLLGVGAWALLGGEDGPGGFFDPNATEGQAPYKTAEEVQAELNRLVEEGMFNISIAGEIEFANGSSQGVAYIENVPGNRYHMKVTITLDDTGETVYESGGIAPGNFIERITLMRDLPAGSYDATATFGAYNTETLDEMGQAAAKVKITVAS